MFLKDIEESKSKITEFDKMVIATLGPKQKLPMRAGRSVKTIRSIINQPHFICKLCDFTSNTSSQLRKHKLTVHSKSFNSTGNSILPITHSTRNNSFSDIVLCEDISIEYVNNKDILDNPDTTISAVAEIKKNTSDQLGSINAKREVCDNEFRSNDDLTTHVITEHQDKNTIHKEVTEIFSEKCENKSTTQKIMDVHIEEKHVNKSQSEPKTDKKNS